MDFTLCNNNQCIKRNSCLRFLLRKHASCWQSLYGHNIGDKGIKCEVYVNVGEGHSLAFDRDDASSSPQ
jgi:hypothetical protein